MSAKYKPIGGIRFEDAAPKLKEEMVHYVYNVPDSGGVPCTCFCFLLLLACIALELVVIGFLVWLIFLRY